MLDHIGDILSDLSVFHRIDDADTLAIPAFCQLAVRLGAYDGAMRRVHLAPSATPNGAVTPAPDGDTPPEVIAQMKRQAVAQRYNVDPDSIDFVSESEIIRELMR